MGDILIDSHIGPWGLSMNEMINTFPGPWGLYMMQRSFLLSGNALDSIGARMIWTRQKSGLCTGQSEAAITATPKSRIKNVWWGETSHFPCVSSGRGLPTNVLSASYKGGRRLSRVLYPSASPKWLERTLLWPWGLNVFLHTRALAPSCQHVASKPVVRLSQLSDSYAVSFDKRAVGI